VIAPLRFLGLRGGVLLRDEVEHERVEGLGVLEHEVVSVAGELDVTCVRQAPIARVC
jgi:hypothetical protein